MRVVELFAGVGGFRIGLEGAPDNRLQGPFNIIWANQWEPTTKKQHAAEIYTNAWSLTPSEEDSEIYVGEEEVFVNKDISQIDSSEIPEHDLLCGGFPCQDYSVAKTANKAAGIVGKKGVLWWEIHRILTDKRPSYALLENVDRLLKSPTSQRGRDFAIMLASLDELGYVVEWREFPASEYGFPQRRRRVYILAHGPGTEGYHKLTSGIVRPEEWVLEEGVFAKAFPIAKRYSFGIPSFDLRGSSQDDLADISENFNKNNSKNASPFLDAGVMINGMVWNTDYKPDFAEKYSKLGDVLIQPRQVPIEFILSPIDMLKEKGWIYQKGAKKEERKGTEGFTYNYSEGPVTFPDDLSRPSRTIITGEGGAGASRFKHVVEFKPTKKQYEELDLGSADAKEARQRLGIQEKKWLRRLTPVELERLNMFPDNHTEGVSDGKRAFLMGNALVCGVIEKIGTELSKRV